MANLAPREKGSNTLASVETAKLIVNQPQPFQELLKVLDSVDTLPDRVSEMTGEGRSRDLGGAGGAAAAVQKRDDAVSARDRAIAAMPTAPEVLQGKLAAHVRGEVAALEKVARKAARAHHPGDAFRLSQLYARIRRLNALLAELLEATVEVLRRLYIRVFIDRQPII